MKLKAESDRDAGASSTFGNNDRVPGPQDVDQRLRERASPDHGGVELHGAS
jgi:hypothetical protein